MASFDSIPRLNLEQLGELIEVDQGRTDLARELWSICIEQVELRFAAMDAALAKADFRTVDQQLHTFKSTCHSAGLGRAHVMSREMQKLVAGETIAPLEVRRALRQLRAEVASGLTELADFLTDQELDQDNELRRTG
ncbi:MAG: Hpt domain-containing protein [Bdellovibrionota bacterium]